MSEHSEQVALLEWASARQMAIPELAYLFAVPNGGYRAKGTAVRLLAEGLKPGVPDLCLPCPRQKWHSCWIEMKLRSGKITEHQDRWMNFLKSQGHYVLVAYSWQEAAQHIEYYLDVPANLRTDFFR